MKRVHLVCRIRPLRVGRLRCGVCFRWFETGARVGEYMAYCERCARAIYRAAMCGERKVVRIDRSLFAVEVKS